MSRKKNNKDMKTLQAISGSEEGNVGFQIETGYFERERIENLAEAGYPVPFDMDTLRSPEEKADYRNTKNLERLELFRCPLYPAYDSEGNPTYPGRDPDDWIPMIKSKIVWIL